MDDDDVGSKDDGETNEVVAAMMAAFVDNLSRAFAIDSQVELEVDAQEKDIVVDVDEDKNNKCAGADADNTMMVYPIMAAMMSAFVDNSSWSFTVDSQVEMDVDTRNKKKSNGDNITLPSPRMVMTTSIAKKK